MEGAIDRKIQSMLSNAGDNRTDSGSYPVGNRKLMDWEKAVKEKYHSGSGKDSEKVRNAQKALANHLWYMANKAKKQQYNEQYYKNNIEYWKKRYQEAKGTLEKSAKKRYNEEKAQIENNRKASEKFMDSLLFVEPNSYDIREYVKKESKIDKDVYDAQNELNESRFKEDMGIAKDTEAVYRMNLKRAYQEYQEFLDSQKKMSIGEAWKLGAKGIVDSGRSFINKLLGR